MKTRKIVHVLMSHVAEKESVANVLNIIGGWVSYRDVYFLPTWNALMIVQSRDSLRAINNKKKLIKLYH